MPPGLKLLPCQRDSYVTQLQTVVVSCAEGKEEGRKQGAAIWEVVLQESCLYPEGGGQPCDRGTIRPAGSSNDEAPAEVLNVERGAGQVVHSVTRPFSIGEEVTVAVDWSRRYDHMQQHTGQHVLSAVVEDVCGADTCSWELHPRSADQYADVTVAIDLSTPTLSQRQLEDIEQGCNRVVREGMAVRCVMSDNQQELEALGGKLRGKVRLPSGDGLEPLRLVVIGDLDVNPCGGTHLRSTAELQVVKLMGVERTRGLVRLRFICGDRVLTVLGRTLMNEARLTKVLSCGPMDHEKSVVKALTERSELLKTKKQLSEELAESLGRTLAAEPGDAHLLHREGAEAPFLSLLASAALASASEPARQVFLLTGGSKGKPDKPADGVFVLAGPPGLVSRVGPEVAMVLGGRGGGRQGHFQGKANHVECAPEALTLLLEALSSDP